MIPTGQEEEGEDHSDHPHLAIDCGFLKANNPDDPADQGSNPTLIWTEAKYGRTLAMAVSREGQCCTMDCEARGGIGWIGWAVKRSP